jgi:hypothetical protein
MSTVIKPISLQINSSSGSTVQPIYSSILDRNVMPYGYVIEFNAAIDISSVAEFNPPTIPLGTSQNDSDNIYYASSKANPGKILEIWIGDQSNPLECRIGSILLWNRRPYYKENVLARLVSSLSSLIIPQGWQLSARMAEWQSNGLLSGADQIDLYGSIVETPEPI